MSHKDPQGRADKFVTLLRKHRIAAGLTQKALAKKLKVKAATVSYWESATYNPHPESVPALAGFLGLTPMELTEILERDEADRINKRPVAATA